jgi:hypothetical protein
VPIGDLGGALSGNGTASEMQMLTPAEVSEEDASEVEHAVSLEQTGSSQSISSLEDTKRVLLWHLRLGHIGNTRLRKAALYNPTISLNPKSDFELGPCLGCEKGKATRADRPSGPGVRAQRLLELLHGDIAGPFTASLGGNRYYVRWVDDLSRIGFVLFLKSKDQAVQSTETLFTFLEKQGLDSDSPSPIQRSSISVIRTDRDGVFLGEQFQELVVRPRGIELQLTARDSAFQNGVVERGHGILFDIARSMLSSAGLPEQFGEHALSHANWLLNRLPTSAVPDGKTPHEVWYGCVPNMSRARVWGCLVWVALKHPGKFSDRAIPCLFLGLVQKDTVVAFNVRTQRIIHSRDVSFQETVPGGTVLANPGAFTYTPPTQDLRLSSHLPYPVVDRALRTDPASLLLEPAPREVPLGEIEERKKSAVLRDEVQHGEESRSRTAEPQGQNDEIDQAQIEEAQIEQTANASSAGTPLNRGHRREKKLPARYASLSAKVHDVHSFATQNKEQVTCKMNGQWVTIDVPQTYNQMLLSPYVKEWWAAMSGEFGSLLEHETYHLVPRPRDKNVVGGRWVWAVKVEGEEFVRFKARWVAQGYTMIAGLDFNNSYAPVVRIDTLRFLLAHAVLHGMYARLTDISNAFLNAPIKEEVYMIQPIGFEDPSYPEAVARLDKAIYGTVQAACCFYEDLSGTLIENGWRVAQADKCLYIKERKVGLSFLTTHVDDIKIFSPSQAVSDLDMHDLRKYKKKDFGEMSHVLNFTVKQETEGEISISQEGYLKRLLQEICPESLHPVKFPVDPGADLSPATEEEQAEMHAYPYAEILGALSHLAVNSRPDIKYPVGKLAKSTKGYGRRHVKALERVLRYLKGTPNLEIVYRKDGNNRLVIMADSAFADESDTGRSTAGYLVFYAGAPISWYMVTLKGVKLSTFHAERSIICEACKTAEWFQVLLTDVGMSPHGPIKIETDNKSNVDSTIVPRLKFANRHLTAMYFYLPECIERGIVDISFCPTEDMIADLLTKPFGSIRHRRLVSMMGMRDPDQPEGTEPRYAEAAIQSRQDIGGDGLYGQ